MSTEVFIGLVTIALVDAVKDQWPEVKGKVTVALAGVIGGLLAGLTQVFSEQLTGLPEVSLAVGVAAGLAAAGAVGGVKKISK